MNVSSTYNQSDTAEFSQAIKRLEVAWFTCAWAEPRDAKLLLDRYRARVREIKDLKQYRNLLEQENHHLRRDVVVLQDILLKTCQPKAMKFRCRRRLYPIVRRAVR